MCNTFQNQTCAMLSVLPATYSLHFTLYYL